MLSPAVCQRASSGEERRVGSIPLRGRVGGHTEPEVAQVTLWTRPTSPVGQVKPPLQRSLHVVGSGEIKYSVCSVLGALFRLRDEHSWLWVRVWPQPGTLTPQIPALPEMHWTARLRCVGDFYSDVLNGNSAFQPIPNSHLSLDITKTLSQLCYILTAFLLNSEPFKAPVTGFTNALLVCVVHLQ